MSEAASTPAFGPAKVAVVDELGEPTLLLPSLLNRGLEANSRAKYLLSLLQAARGQAEAPSQPHSSLHDERIAAGILDPALDEVVAGAHGVSPGLYAVPGAERIHHALVAAVGDMLAPLEVAQRTDGVDRTRLAALIADAPDLKGDQIPGSYVDSITSARRDVGDSLHLLVMDAHRALNTLQAEIATSSIDGAAVYGLEAGDSALVASFMAGLHETAPLKFDHPGLATSATHVSSRLLIQNDLGMTNAHVVVIAVEGLTATVTYTDVHLRRLRFFTSLFESFQVHWSDAERRRGEPSLGEHHLTVGRYEAPDLASLGGFLRHLGSRLVFVIDWNRARKHLAAFLSQTDAIEVLRWAADSNVGHMAFLLLGAERLIYEAVELSAKVPARYGEPLVEVFGRDATVAVTQFALRASAEGMLAGKSPLLIRDELRVEVLRHVEAAHRRLLEASAEHATLVVECAKALQAALVRLGTPAGWALLQRAVRRAADWEHRADQVLVAQRQAGKRVEGGESVTDLTTLADDAIDGLEESLFLLTLLPDGSVPVVRPVLQPLVGVAVTAAREHMKTVELARKMIDGSGADDLEDFLVAVDRVAALEHEADRADRVARAALASGAPDFRSLYVADSLSRGAEAATDALLRSALGLRDYVLRVLAVR